MRLGGEVDDDVDALVAERRLGQLAIADVALHEHDPVLDGREVRPVARVREQVVDDDVVVRVALEPVVDEVRADEPGAAGDEEPHARKAILRKLRSAAIETCEPRSARAPQPR